MENMKFQGFREKGAIERTKRNSRLTGGRFCNNSKIDKLISKRLYVENKAKLSQLSRADFVTIAKLRQ